jgi:redox-sensitive bicupin YhaK (pirin superfamily)
MNANLKATVTRREIVLRTRGRRHGAITRLVSPSDIGELIKPFVFLDLFETSGAQAPGFGWHPHSGIATLTVLHEGSLTYQETTGVAGTLTAGGVEWMRAGRGVWHTGSAKGEDPIRGFQLWIALPAALEHSRCESHYLSAHEVPHENSARVILGACRGVKSSIAAPAPINYLDVQLSAGERWTYVPPRDHEVAWLAVSQGLLQASGAVSAGELVVFEESNDSIEIQAETASRFVLGSAAKHPHSLVLGNYSVHTTIEALEIGESEIRRIGHQLQADGLLS